jgi:hypothetical protein
VDIITLSLVLTRETEALKEAFQAAYDKGIVVLCSTSDAGKNWKDTWPAKYALRTDGLEPKGFPNILGIGACDKQGYPLDTTQDIGYPYQFKGKDIYVGPIPFVASTDTISGSSVSTAIAAGVASLILSSYHLAGNEGALTKKWISVIARFNAMAERDKVDPRYVLLQNIAGPAGFGKGSSLTNALTNIFSKPIDESKGRLC